MSDATTAKAGYRLIPELREMVKGGTLEKGTGTDGWQEYRVRAKRHGRVIARLHFYWGEGGKSFGVEYRDREYFVPVDGIRTQRQAATWIQERLVRDDG